MEGRFRGGVCGRGGEELAVKKLRAGSPRVRRGGWACVIVKALRMDARESLCSFKQTVAKTQLPGKLMTTDGDS